MKTTVIISRNDNPALEDKVAELCASSGLSVFIVPHIYHIPENDQIWDELGSLDGNVILVSALYPRPAEWLFRKHWNGENIFALNISNYDSAEECFEAILHNVHESSILSSVEGCGQFSTLHFTQSLPDRWYPIIDLSRCRNCRNCLQFCLFGVYETDSSGQVAATNPDKCKPGCPACSRICPEGAIIFPLCKQSVAIAGAPGLFMSPDAAARRMYYARTKLTCPVCGSSEDSRTQETDGVDICQECGRPIVNAGDASSPGTELRDEIDQLIDDLDGLTRKN